MTKPIRPCLRLTYLLEHVDVDVHTGERILVE